MDSANAHSLSVVVGSAAWFHSVKGLNNFGYIPGFPRSHPHHLPASLVSEKDCRARWDRVAAGFRYASEGREESPTMQERIESLFAITHQRPIGSTKTIGVAFARGILAEKMGFSVNWAEFARKQCNRRHSVYEPLRENEIIKHATEDRPRYWIFDEETKQVVYRLVGCVEDWNVNNKYKDPRVHHTLEDFDFRATFDKYPSQVIGRPVYVPHMLWQGNKSDDNDKHTSPDTGGPINSEHLSDEVKQAVQGTRLDRSQDGQDGGKEIANPDDCIVGLPPKKRDSTLQSWKTARTTVVDTAFITAAETLGGHASSVSVNREDDGGKTSPASDNLAKRRRLNDTKGESVSAVGASKAPSNFQVIGLHGPALLVMCSSCESSPAIQVDVEDSAITPTSQGPAKKYRH